MVRIVKTEFYKLKKVSYPLGGRCTHAPIRPADLVYLYGE